MSRACDDLAAIRAREKAEKAENERMNRFLGCSNAIDSTPAAKRGMSDTAFDFAVLGSIALCALIVFLMGPLAWSALVWALKGFK